YVNGATTSRIGLQSMIVAGRIAGIVNHRSNEQSLCPWFGIAARGVSRRLSFFDWNEVGDRLRLPPWHRPVVRLKVAGSGLSRRMGFLTGSRSGAVFTYCRGTGWWPDCLGKVGQCAASVRQAREGLLFTAHTVLPHRVRRMERGEGSKPPAGRCQVIGTGWLVRQIGPHSVWASAVGSLAWRQQRPAQRHRQGQGRQRVEQRLRAERGPVLCGPFDQSQQRPGVANQDATGARKSTRLGGSLATVAGAGSGTQPGETLGGARPGALAAVHAAAAVAHRRSLAGTPLTSAGTTAGREVGIAPRIAVAQGTRARGWSLTACRVFHISWSRGRLCPRRYRGFGAAAVAGRRFTVYRVLRTQRVRGGWRRV